MGYFLSSVNASLLNIAKTQVPTLRPSLGFLTAASVSALPYVERCFQIFSCSLVDPMFVLDRLLQVSSVLL